MRFQGFACLRIEPLQYHCTGAGKQRLKPLPAPGHGRFIFFPVRPGLYEFLTYLGKRFFNLPLPVFGQGRLAPFAAAAAIVGNGEIAQQAGGEQAFEAVAAPVQAVVVDAAQAVGGVGGTGAADGAGNGADDCTGAEGQAAGGQVGGEAGRS